MSIDWQSLLGITRVRETARYWLEEGSIAVSDRLDLLGIEAKRQMVAVVGVVVGAVLALVFLFGLLFIGSIAALLHYAQTPAWGTALWVVLGAWALALVIAAVVAACMVRRLAKPFALTRQVIAQDIATFKERL